MNGVTVVIPTVGAPRRKMLARALASVRAQTVPPDQIVVATDLGRRGAAATRQAGLDTVDTTLVGFVDDDDVLYPHHIATLLAAMTEHHADLCYAWFDVAGGADPFPQFFGQPWDPAHPHHTTVTFLAKTEALRDVGGFLAVGPPNPTHPDSPGEEYRAVLALNAAGGKIVHVPERTWRWHHTGQNSSGLPGRIQWT